METVDTQSSKDQRYANIFLFTVFAYFALRTVFRTALGGAFEYDEAEMFVLAP
ncbi:hypothetical protein [Celeribacter neptunius]|uniref:Uncharacterized protein n=1 Tax=Celeribacter neptunius TaxID=588602 RepID=A0A1I3UNS6_9RHOB|nr:hypothetical protein [Celeribacter neptunius]SFJ84690.1 hypothetical protein SAMN04487991_3142 [Celeribacter neptunius]